MNTLLAILTAIMVLLCFCAVFIIVGALTVLVVFYVCSATSMGGRPYKISRLIKKKMKYEEKLINLEKELFNLKNGGIQ
ncbi:MAG: hypothetical protein ACRC0F_09645 [Cetobacterium sp.]